MHYEEFDKELEKLEKLNKYKMKAIKWFDEKEFIIVSLLSLGFGLRLSALYLSLSGVYSILAIARTPLESLLMLICVSAMFCGIFFVPYIAIKLIQRCYYTRKCEKLGKELKLFK